jgi:hypothetical protein
MDSNSLPANLPVENLTFEGRTIAAVNVCDLLDLLYPGYWSARRYMDIDYADSQSVIEEWCSAHGAYYYAAPRDEFSVSDAVLIAADKGLSVVVLEDLS